MKVIYLRGTNSAVTNDIKKVFSKYAGEIEFQADDMQLHWVGDVMLVPPVLDNTGDVILVPGTYVGKMHANILVPDSFDDSIFSTKITEPRTPEFLFF